MWIAISPSGKARLKKLVEHRMKNTYRHRQNSFLDVNDALLGITVGTAKSTWLSAIRTTPDRCGRIAIRKRIYLWGVQ
jgi:hypothetical protein